MHVDEMPRLQASRGFSPLRVTRRGARGPSAARRTPPSSAVRPSMPVAMPIDSKRFTRSSVQDVAGEAAAVLHLRRMSADTAEGRIEVPHARFVTPPRSSPAPCAVSWKWAIGVPPLSS